MKRALFWAAALVLCSGLWASAQLPGSPFGAVGGGGVASSLVCLLAGGASCTMTGTLVSNTAAGTNAVLSETGIDRSSGSAETFVVTNSGAGENTLTPDALNVVGASQMGGTLTHNAVASDVACGAGETWTNTCTNATFSTGKVTVPTLATTTSEFLMSSSFVNGTIAASTYFLAFKVPQSVTVKRVTAGIGAVVGGTGNLVWTFTDGTNTCTCTKACPLTASSVNEWSCVNGAGTGCTYASSASVRGNITTDCTTSSPAAGNVSAWAIYN